MKLHPLPAFQDNYLWLLQDGPQALVVDPGDAPPVLEGLRSAAARLQVILVTHHHGDHTGGVRALHEATGAVVYGPAREDIPGPFVAVRDGDTVQALGLAWTVIEVPGHTAGHVAYYCPDVDGAPLLFCGDTLFSGGCGRLFEGTPAQMLASLDRLAALPATTRVCCAHEYTLSNLRFAAAVDPANPSLLQWQAAAGRLRDEGKVTVPTTVALERATNPFLRCTEPALVDSASARVGRRLTDPVDVFAALREWKNVF